MFWLVVVGMEQKEGLLLVVVIAGHAAVVQESKGLAVHQQTVLRGHLSAQNMVTASAVLIRLVEQPVVQV